MLDIVQTQWESSVCEIYQKYFWHLSWTVTSGDLLRDMLVLFNHLQNFQIPVKVVA